MALKQGTPKEESSESNIEREMEMLECQMDESFPRPGKTVNMNSLNQHTRHLKSRSLSIMEVALDGNTKRIA